MIFKSKRRRYNSVKNGRNNNTETMLCVLQFTATSHVKEIFYEKNRTEKFFNDIICNLYDIFSECQFVNR